MNEFANECSSARRLTSTSSASPFCRMIARIRCIASMRFSHSRCVFSSDFLIAANSFSTSFVLDNCTLGRSSKAELNISSSAAPVPVGRPVDWSVAEERENQLINDLLMSVLLIDGRPFGKKAILKGGASINESQLFKSLSCLPIAGSFGTMRCSD